MDHDVDHADDAADQKLKHHSPSLAGQVRRRRDRAPPATLQPTSVLWSEGAGRCLHGGFTHALFLMKNGSDLPISQAPEPGAEIPCIERWQFEIHRMPDTGHNDEPAVR